VGCGTLLFVLRATRLRKECAVTSYRFDFAATRGGGGSDRQQTISACNCGTILSMHFRKRSSSWAIWVFVAALLLKSAMPFLAQASAQLQGKALVEVCTVYGVSLMPADDDTGQKPGRDQAFKHSHEHCALTTLGGFASADPTTIAVVPVAQLDSSRPHAHPSSQAPDACATWVARLKHGPPVLA